MTLTIDFGWWLAPLALTLAAFAWAFIKCPSSQYPSYADGITAMFFYFPATIFSLIAWLVWAVMT